MDAVKELEKLIIDNNGILTYKKCKEMGIHHEYLKKYVLENKLNKISRGVYVSPDSWEDKMYIIQLQSKKVIYSHATALYLNELTDRDPIQYDVTVPIGYNVSRLKEKGLKTHSVKKEFYEIGLIKAQTMFGNQVYTYNMERTICDIVKARHKMDSAIFNDAMKMYAGSKKKDIRRLYEYAEMFKVSKLVKRYMEVLL